MCGNDGARLRAARRLTRSRAPLLPPQDASDKRGSKKSSKKTVELDEKLWSQTQLSVASWADCDDEDAPFDAPPPSADAGAHRWLPRAPWRAARPVLALTNPCFLPFLPARLVVLSAEGSRPADAKDAESDEVRPVSKPARPRLGKWLCGG